MENILKEEYILRKENFTEEEWENLQDKYFPDFYSVFSILGDLLENVKFFDEIDNLHEELKEAEDVFEVVLENKDYMEYIKENSEEIESKYNSIFNTYSQIHSIFREDIINIDPLLLETLDKTLSYLYKFLRNMYAVDALNKYIKEYNESSNKFSLALDIVPKFMKKNSRDEYITSFFEEECNSNPGKYCLKAYYRKEIEELDVLRYLRNLLRGNGINDKNCIDREEYNIFPILTKEKTGLQKYLNKYMECIDEEEGLYKWGVEKKN